MAFSVIQNHLQFVAISNLEATTFQVSYQLKILTTALFSVLLLRKQLSSSQWPALFLLAIGVGIVQIQSSTGGATTIPNLVPDMNTMNRMKGLVAVIAACFTSGLAGVYFEMVLKNSSTDVWVRNVQLSLFSLLPALSPIIFTYAESSKDMAQTWSFVSLFDNFGPWAWATVATQVIGGLVTAMVIKYSDNILKGFATSLSIVISFLASVVLFNFVITFTFLLGSLLVVAATCLYNQPQRGSGGSAKGDLGVGRQLVWSGKSQYLPRSIDDETFSMSLLSQSDILPGSESAWEQNRISHSLGSTRRTS
jgi:solute carrier family 35 (UDP-sugar transporter), member A1/2/3